MGRRKSRAMSPPNFSHSTASRGGPNPRRFAGWPVYADGSDKYKTRGEIANPNNYLILPDIYTEQQARAFAARIANTIAEGYLGDVAECGGIEQREKIQQALAGQDGRQSRSAIA